MGSGATATCRYGVSDAGPPVTLGPCELIEAARNFEEAYAFDLVTDERLWSLDSLSL